MQTNITAIVITKNEEKNIKACLNNLKWCGEIIVIDDNSSDKTVEISREAGAKVYKRTLDDFSSQRNFALSKANGDWIIFIDADEIVSETLAYEISNVISEYANGRSKCQAFLISRIDVVWGNELRYGESGIKLLRLAKRNSGKWQGLVHERWKIEGKVGVLNNLILHYPHQTITEFLKEINFYTTLRAEELFSSKIKSNSFSIIAHPLGKFVLIYFLKKGFLDGIPGLAYALLMSFHSFLVRGKLWLMRSRE